MIFQTYSFVFLIFSSSVDLGSGVHLDIPLHTKQVRMSTQPPHRLNNLSELHTRSLPPASPVSVTEVDGIEIKVERIPIRYERVEDIFDELPDFAQEIIAMQTLNK